MKIPTENENWIIDFGDEIIEMKYDHGIESLSEIETLIYCLWVADYSMRNSGDLIAGIDLYPHFKEQGKSIAEKLQLHITNELFSFDKAFMETKYFLYFEEVCNELKRYKKSG